MTETAFEWFQRAVALYCLLFGTYYWVRLVGFYPGSLWRFDLMPVQWQVAAPTLAVLFPFAAIGLWMLSSWGPVIWFICAAIETVMYALLPERFGRLDPVVLLHLAVAVAYIAFRLALFLQRRRAALTVH
ncbi:MAG: DUF6163 family protein [Rhizobiaceae bacterium]|jgi:hypothetical protein